MIATNRIFADVHSDPHLVRKVNFNAFQKWQIDNLPRPKQFDFATNKIRTARYTLLTFFPLALLVQFTKVGNIFWTSQFVLNVSSRKIATQNPWPILFLIGTVVSLGMFKEFLSDYKRKVADRLTNESRHRRVVSVSQSTKQEDLVREARRRSLTVQGEDGVHYSYKWNEVLCQDIKVGDLLILTDNVTVPADCILVKTFSNHGECQIQTGQLDGERSLKSKYALPSIQDTIDDILQQPQLAAKLTVHCAAPNQSLFYFDGCLDLPSGQQVELSLDNFLPRGAQMQGCGDKGVLALVLYTGRDSKLVLNQGRYKYKMSNTEVNLNLIFLFQTALIIFFSTLFAVLSHSYIGENRASMSYIFQGMESDGVYSVFIFFSFWVILTRWIPFDLIVQFDTGKILYSKFMEWDTQMVQVDRETGELLHCRVQSMQLPEQLGEVDHIFCDKTGTLTQNDLEVKALCINGVTCLGETREELNNEVYMKLSDNDIVHRLYQCFCLCNSVVVVTNQKTKAIKYDASSQDELLLVELARQSNYYKLVRRDQFSMTLLAKQSGRELHFNILRSIEFSVERKRQSVVVKNPEDGRIYVFMKGADEVVFTLLSHESSRTEETKKQMEAVDKFAEDGLRTLVFALRVFEDGVSE